MSDKKLSPNFYPPFRLDFLLAIEALANGDLPPPAFADNLNPFLEDPMFWKTMHRNYSSLEVYEQWLVRLFFAVLKRLMKADIEQARGEPHICSSECPPCCQHTSNQMVHLVWSDVNAKVARLIKDPSSTESKKLMEKYAKDVTNTIQDCLMYG